VLESPAYNPNPIEHLAKNFHRTIAGIYAQYKQLTAATDQPTKNM